MKDHPVTVSGKWLVETRDRIEWLEGLVREMGDNLGILIDQADITLPYYKEFGYGLMQKINFNIIRGILNRPEVRKIICGAEEKLADPGYVLVRREDLGNILNLMSPDSQDSTYLRLKAALEYYPKAGRSGG